DRSVLRVVAEIRHDLVVFLVPGHRGGEGPALLGHKVSGLNRATGGERVELGRGEGVLAPLCRGQHRAIGVTTAETLHLEADILAPLVLAFTELAVGVEGVAGLGHTGDVDRLPGQQPGDLIVGEAVPAPRAVESY